MRNAFRITLKIIIKIYSITLTNSPKSIFQDNVIEMFDPKPNIRKLMSTNLNIFKMKESSTH